MERICLLDERVGLAAGAIFSMPDTICRTFPEATTSFLLGQFEPHREASSPDAKLKYLLHILDSHRSKPTRTEPLLETYALGDCRNDVCFVAFKRLTVS